MKKVLKIVVIVSGVISAVVALVLGCLYLEEIMEWFQKMSSGMLKSFNNSSAKEDAS